MTRFARAKGSKASNLKSPEDSTPWEVMKEQLLKSKKDSEETKNREEAEKQRIENYNKFLKDQKTQKRKATWCEFPEAQTNKINSTASKSENHVKNKKKKLSNQSDVVNSQENIQNYGYGDGKEKINKVPKKKNKKNKSNNVEHSIETSPEEINDNDHQEDANMSTEQNQITSNQTRTPQKKKKQRQSSDIKSNSATDISETEVNNSEKNPVEQNNSQKTEGRKKKKNKKQKVSEPNLNVESSKSENNTELLNSEKNGNPVEQNNSQKTEGIKKKKNKKQKVSKPNLNVESSKSENNTEQKVSTVNQPAPLKKRKNKQGRRKPVNDKSFQLIINSKEVELVRFDGFPIMKRDAERLEELKKSMIQKGIPKSEVQRTMKLERRRAEKALARLKRDVCYNCRKGGHNLSDCPDLKSNIPSTGATDGVCFKCGSTEHRQFECKVQRDKEFRFATCFICKEAGHIARQCPDNPKGLYPNGGCCKLCGDVTHLRKDCPTVNEKKESTSIKLQTLTGDNIEDLGQSVKQVTEEPVSKKPKKITF